jgi:hypothetical protein
MNIRSFPHNFTILKIHLMDGAVFGEQIMTPSNDIKYGIVERGQDQNGPSSRKIHLMDGPCFW